MKYIKNLTGEELLPRGLTLPFEKGETNPVANEEILEWEEIQELINQGKIAIIEDD